MNTITGFSPRYASPELLERGARGPWEMENYQKMDVYAYGVILWEIVTRKVPWEGFDLGQIASSVVYLSFLPSFLLPFLSFPFPSFCVF